MTIRKDNLKEVVISQNGDGSFQMMLTSYDGQIETEKFHLMNDLIKEFILKSDKFKSFFVEV